MVRSHYWLVEDFGIHFYLFVYKKKISEKEHGFVCIGDRSGGILKEDMATEKRVLAEPHTAQRTTVLSPFTWAHDGKRGSCTIILNFFIKI